jgi:hypothetical protein
MSRSRRLTSMVVALLVGVAAPSTPAAAQPVVSGPTLVVDRSEVSPGDRVVLTIAGFQGQPVIISVCGNQARRGSVDCDMTSSLARETQVDRAVGTDFTVTAPPAPCPCLIRVSSQNNLQVAIAPMVIVGHPVGEVVGGATASQPLGVAITANPAPDGAGATLRSLLGGSTTYDVTIRVTNRATFEVENIAVAATFTRGWSDDTRNVEIPDPGTLAPGQTWIETVQADVPALTFGDVEWRATVSGQGPSVTATDITPSQPILLWLLGAILVIDLLILLVRQIIRMRRDEDDEWEPTNPFLDPDGSDDEPLSTTSAPDRRDSELVG